MVGTAGGTAGRTEWARAGVIGVGVGTEVIGVGVSRGVVAVAVGLIDDDASVGFKVASLWDWKSSISARSTGKVGRKTSGETIGGFDDDDSVEGWCWPDRRAARFAADLCLERLIAFCKGRGWEKVDMIDDDLNQMLAR